MRELLSILPKLSGWRRFVTILEITKQKAIIKDILQLLEALIMVSYPKSTDKAINELNLSEKLKEYPEWDRETQLKKNQPAMRLLAQLIQEHKNMSDEEAGQREIFFEGFKEIVDAHRATEAKLYSNE